MYVNGVLPLVDAGSVILTDVFSTQVWSLVAVSDGVASASTSIVNSSLTSSPFASSTLYVYVAALCVADGVPVNTRVPAVKLTPVGSVPSRLYVRGVFPLLDSGSVIVTEDDCTHVWSLVAVSDGLVSVSTSIVNSSVASWPSRSRTL